MTFSEVARGLDNLQFALDVECDCTWENGSWDGFDGQSSETGTSVEDSRAADDFCLTLRVRPTFVLLKKNCYRKS